MQSYDDMPQHKTMEECEKYLKKHMEEVLQSLSKKNPIVKGPYALNLSIADAEDFINSSFSISDLSFFCFPSSSPSCFLFISAAFLEVFNN